MAVPVAGDELTATALRALAAGLIDDWAGMAFVATQQSRSNNTFGDLATVGPSVTLTSQGTKALCLWGAIVFGSATAAASGRMTVAISGATTLTASASNGFYSSENAGTGVGGAGIVGRRFDINPGSNTFAAKYNNIAANGSAFFQDRWLLVIAP